MQNINEYTKIVLVESGRSTIKVLVIEKINLKDITLN